MRIRQLGDPILRQTAKVVNEEDFSSSRVKQTLAHMREVLNGIKTISDENGNALSAPQLGYSMRIVLLRIDQEFVAMINPEFNPVDDTTFAFEEECFSMYQLRGTVERYRYIAVNYLDENNNPQSFQLNGENAGLLQHEVDHLDGVLFIDRLNEGESPRSIDYDLREHPQRLAQVKKMLAYMVGV